MISPYTRKPDVTAEVLPDGSMVLFDPATMMAYPISASAAVIWEACDAGPLPAGAIDDLLAVYSAPRDVIERDVETFLAQLVELGLLAPLERVGKQ